MFCSNCGTRAEDGAHFCQNCGASLQAPGGIAQQSNRYMAPEGSAAPGGSLRSGSVKPQDPYKEQIQQLKLQIRQLKLDLKEITTRMSSIRSRYYESAAFVPRGLLRWGDKAIEDFRLLGPQQQKEQLQRQIMQLEQELLGLQQAQAQWKAQQ
jgi:predicted amidophosphoribosyltransferase